MVKGPTLASHQSLDPRKAVCHTPRLSGRRCKGRSRWVWICCMIRIRFCTPAHDKQQHFCESVPVLRSRGISRAVLSGRSW